MRYMKACGWLKIFFGINSQYKFTQTHRTNNQPFRSRSLPRNQPKTHTLQMPGSHSNAKYNKFTKYWPNLTPPRYKTRRTCPSRTNQPINQPINSHQPLINTRILIPTIQPSKQQYIQLKTLDCDVQHKPHTSTNPHYLQNTRNRA